VHPLRLLAALAITLTTPLTAQAHWSRLYPTVSPPALYDFAMAFDSVRARTVLFGGASTGLPFSAQMFTFDGTTWAPAAGAAPLARARFAMVFDEQRGLVVMFGGNGYWGRMQDTWEWDGTAWTQRLPAISPSARDYHVMAYDRERHVTVLFGGQAPGLAADTWEWDGAIWAQRQSPVSPSPRAMSAMAFDPTLGGVLLFGGGGSSEPLDDTWRWDGAGWQRLFPANPATIRSGHMMAADLHRRRVVLLGSPYDMFAWEWDGTNWSARLVSSPSTHLQGGLVYDSTRRQVVKFGGLLAYASSYPTSNDTWVYRTDEPAVLATIGAGCPGSLGTADLAAAPYSLPWLGDLFATRVSPVPAGGAVLFATGFAAPVPVPLAPFGMPGCTLVVSVAETRLAFASAGGVAGWSLSIPNSSALAGIEIAQQVLVLDAPANAGGAVLSSAVTFRLGIR